ncbi:MAG: precorrin-2 dehydrogenase/sirohydrochlorin ferrochelatase family protein [Desulfatiglandales bacterium]
MTYYPILLDLKGKKALVVGGGKVARRKIDTLLEYGARVHVIAKELNDTLREYADGGRVRYLGSEFIETHLNDVFLVIAATDDARMNQEISVAARSRGLLINAVDQPADCNFIVPSILRRGNLQIAVSTSGRSPALARKVREDLENAFGFEYAELLNLLGQLRKTVLARCLSGAENKKIFYELVHSPLIEALAKGDWGRGASIVNGILGSRYSGEDIRGLSLQERPGMDRKTIET